MWWVYLCILSIQLEHIQNSLNQNEFGISCSYFNENGSFLFHGKSFEKFKCRVVLWQVNLPINTIQSNNVCIPYNEQKLVRAFISFFAKKMQIVIWKDSFSRADFIQVSDKPNLIQVVYALLIKLVDFLAKTICDTGNAISEKKTSMRRLG